MQCILIFLDAMHFNILRQSGRSVYAYFKIYFYMPNFASIGRVDLVICAGMAGHRANTEGDTSAVRSCVWSPGPCLHPAHLLLLQVAVLVGS